MTTTQASHFKVTRIMHMGMNPYAICQHPECGWEHPAGPGTLDLAKLHTQTTGHDVAVIREDRSLYRREPRAGRK